MKNCKVTELKAIVNNDNLEKFGVIQVTVPTSTDAHPSVGITLNGEHTVKILNEDEYVVDAWSGCAKIDNHTVMCTGQGGFEMSRACTVILEIHNKYDIETFEMARAVVIKGGIDSFYASLSSFKTVNTTMSFDTSELKKFNNLSYFNVGTGAYLTGKTDDLQDLVLLEYFKANSGLKNTISGNINKLGKLVSLTTFMSDSNNITGSLESLVEMQRVNGRTSESTGIAFGYGIANVTFNGESCLKNHDCTLTWTSTTITYDGVTITA